MTRVVVRENSRRARVGSCGHRRETILVVQSAENWRRDDAMTITNVMVVREWWEAIGRRLGNPWSQAGVGAAAIVVSDPLPKQTPHVALIQRNHEIQTLSADRADQAFAESVRLRRPHRRLEDRQPHRRDRPIDTLGVNAVVVMDDISMRLIARHDHAELLARPLRVGWSVTFQCRIRRVPTSKTTKM